MGDSQEEYYRQQQEELIRRQREAFDAEQAIRDNTSRADHDARMQALDDAQGPSGASGQSLGCLVVVVFFIIAAIWHRLGW